MSRPGANHFRKLALLGVVLALAALATALLASPAGAGHKPNHNPKGDEGGTTYNILVTGDVATVNSKGDPSAFTTPGKDSRTGLELQSNQLVKIFLDLDAIGVFTHDSTDVCGTPVPQALDNAEWSFRFIRIEEGHLHAKFTLRYEGDCSFDEYRLHFGFDLDEYDGPTIYTSNGRARVFISHIGEVADPNKPNGKKRITHRDVILDTVGHNITVSINPVRMTR